MSLFVYCKTDNEKKVIEAYEEDTTQTYSELERRLGGSMHRTSISRAIQRVKDRAALQGYAPDHDMIKESPNTHVVKGTSTLYDDMGNVKQQWVKTNIKMDAQLVAAEAVIDAMKEDMPKATPVAETHCAYDEDLLSLITFSDHHLGMLAWGEEGGSDWDANIAEDILIQSFDAMLNGSPNAETCIVNNLGDFMHFDGWSSVTPTHGHLLDSDSRFPKMVRSAIRVIRKIIDLALQKHKYVHVKMIEGNHDMASSVWLRELFSVFYEFEPRVTVDTSPRPYQVYEFGNVMLGFHHGHCRKLSSLPLLFASEFSELWGITKYRYAHAGHRHHQEIKEHSGITIEQHSTLASRDGYASRGGYSAQRRATCITYHRDFGEVARNYVSPEMLGYL